MKLTATVIRALFLLLSALLLMGCAGQGPSAWQPAEPQSVRLAMSDADSETSEATQAPQPQVPVTATPAPLSESAIYVLDPQDGELVSRIWVVDPQAQKVVRSFPARYTPDVAFSPDGRQLYVADGYYTQVIRGEWRDVLSVYDARSGELLHDEVPVLDRLMYKVLPHNRQYLFLSPEGRRLFVRKYGDPDVHRLRLTVLDTGTFDVLAEYPACVSGDLWPLSGGRLLCVDGATVQFVEALSGEVARTVYLPLGEVASAVGPAGERLYLVSADARVAVMDVEVEPPQLTGDPVSLDAPPGAKVAEGQIVLSPNGARLYVRFLTGNWRTEGLDAADEIWAFDTRTWEKVGAFEPPAPTWDMALSADGRQLYTVSPWAQALSIFDTTTFREIGVIRDLGETPALIVVPSVGGQRIDFVTPD